MKRSQQSPDENGSVVGLMTGSGTAMGEISRGEEMPYTPSPCYAGYTHHPTLSLLQ